MTQSLSGYAARTKFVGPDEIHTRLQIYNRKTGRVAWSRLLGPVHKISWSADHRAVAILEVCDTPQHRILIWQEGQGVCIISRLPIVEKEDQITYHRNLFGSDSMMQATLSPDRKRMLIRASRSQGGEAFDMGTLWCLTLKTRRIRFVYPSAKGPARWLSAGKIAYTQWHLDETTSEKGKYVPVTQIL